MKGHWVVLLIASDGRGGYKTHVFSTGSHALTENVCNVAKKAMITSGRGNRKPYVERLCVPTQEDSLECGYLVIDFLDHLARAVRSGSDPEDTIARAVRSYCDARNGTDPVPPSRAASPETSDYQTRATAAESGHSCKGCSKWFRRKRDCARYENSSCPILNPKPKEKFQCSVCSRSFVRKRKCEHHERKKTCRKRFQCSDCDQFFVRKYHFERHEQETCPIRHPKPKPKFQCSMCGGSFTTKQACTRHENEICPKNPSAKKTSRWTTKLRNMYNAKRRRQRSDARAAKHETTVDDTLEAYWKDKPIYRTKEEVIEICRTDKLSSARIQDMLDEARKRVGRQTPVCACATCGEMCFYREGHFKELADAWFDKFKVSQATYDGYTARRVDSCMSVFPM